jgi:hypothetical protein
MLRDPRFGSKVLDKHEYAAMLESHGEVINKYGELWDCQIESQEDLEERVEELVWAATLMYSVGSWGGNEVEYCADFFTYVQPRVQVLAYLTVLLSAYIVTSVLFIPPICAYLTRLSQTKLFRAHFLTSIAWTMACPWSSGFRSECVHLSTACTTPKRTIVQVLYSNSFPANPCVSDVAVCHQPEPMVPYPRGCARQPQRAPVQSATGTGALQRAVRASRGRVRRSTRCRRTGWRWIPSTRTWTGVCLCVAWLT